MAELRRCAVGCDRTRITDAVFIRVRRDARHFLPLARRQAKVIWDPPVFTANWQTWPAGAAHRKVTVCRALAAVGTKIGAAKQSAAAKSRFLIGPSLFLHHPFGAILFDHLADGMNDLLLGMRLAIFNHLVLDFATLLEVGEVLVGEAVVPAAVPGGERALASSW
jgi:hypothetical protein